MTATLKTVVSDVADSLVAIDSSRVPFRAFKLGVGPYGEPQLLRKVALILNSKPAYLRRVETRRSPDLLIRGSWGLEFKIVRPFGDNGKEAEDWSVNLLHPYDNNTSALGDCMKLLRSNIPEKKAVAVIGYEHDPPRIPIEPLIQSFEILAEKIVKIKLGPRETESRRSLVHPVLQQLKVYAWEVCGTLTPHEG
jgi:hypothetical protein